MDTPLEIHTGAWVIPVTGPPIEQGGIALSQEAIVAVGTRDELVNAYPYAKCIVHPEAALTPPLVNGHIHIELSSLKELAQGAAPERFTDWILSLVSLRQERGAIGEMVVDAAREQLAQQYADGVSAIVDIGNTDVVAGLKNEFPGFLFAYKEYLGFSGVRLEHNVSRLNAEDHDTLCTGHAIYSTHKSLLQALKARCQMQQAVFPVHVAETIAEIEMVARGTGEMVDFLKERGFWDDYFLAEVGLPGAVAYLDRLNLLDKHTLCVHGVHLSDEEITLVAQKNGHICLCPGSNRFLGVGKADVQKMLEAGILPALGTDSLASNPEISLWREMQLLSEEHPAVSPEAIFAMATLGGAQALGLEEQLGALVQGRVPEVLSIQLPPHISSDSEVMRYLVTTGSSITPERINLSGSMKWHV